MNELLHRIKVFVFRLEEGLPDYLLLRGGGHESFWGPIQGPLGFGEKLETAIRREVLDDLGIARPLDLIDLQLPHRWLVGDEEIIEWTFGCRVLPRQEPVRIGDRWSEFRWAGFSLAYPCLELEPDRVAIMRLHTLLLDAA